ncbi:MAG: hypothetical protein KTR13_04480 [Saprospiraceae bacterium]|nr:hypothetical protein [Saprospiraceae bacterium]
MKHTLLLFSFTVIALVSHSQGYQYEPSAEFPYGQINPEAPAELSDWAPLIGKCNCTSEVRNKEGNWDGPTDMQWVFKYIMNGMAVQDLTLKADGNHSGSIRQYNVDSTKWYVHYFASNTPTATLSSWEGTKHEDGNIVLYRDQTAPNGMEGYFRLTFSNISTAGFNWVGEWVNKAETITYPTWRIVCTKEE